MCVHHDAIKHGCDHLGASWSCKQNLDSSEKMTPFLRPGHVDNMPVFLAARDRGPLRSRPTFGTTVLNPSIPYSANSHWISTDASSNTVIR
ncbi:hypothetical protein TNCV_1569621 [Trichonephila clavipes]|uniref:Uncharacterized protein n=1 Tax=Trichonephila clavipes TaxID=2585209 RepID=A0A8X6STS9_TRICX|nr:hypothetical protein TNCV_1569621 [Trichonephila clavipes]